MSAHSTSCDGTRQRGTIEITRSAKRQLLPLCLLLSLLHCCESFVTGVRPSFLNHELPSSFSLRKATTNLPSSTSTSIEMVKLSSLPDGISPFERSLSKSIDVQGDFRVRAKPAVEAAIADGVRRVEIEFPPLIGGDQSKNQFDDFDNIQELDRNKDWTMQFVPNFLGKVGYGEGKTWLVFPDLKECEIARKEWAGKQYNLATFTTIEATTNFLLGDGSYDAPWGSSLVSGVSKLIGGESGDAGLLGDESALDTLVEGENAPAKIYFVIQPGNGGPVEDWVNCEKIYDASSDSTVMVIINGALNKVRGGYYPGVFFPKLAATVDRFFQKFESVFYLKPLTDKGVYGWLYRVYPEPWQVVLQTTTKKNGELQVDNTVVHTSDERPDYNTALKILVNANAQRK